MWAKVLLASFVASSIEGRVVFIEQDAAIARSLPVTHLGDFQSRIVKKSADSSGFGGAGSASVPLSSYGPAAVFNSAPVVSSYGAASAPAPVFSSAPVSTSYGSASSPLPISAPAPVSAPLSGYGSAAPAAAAPSRGNCQVRRSLTNDGPGCQQGGQVGRLKSTISECA